MTIIRIEKDEIEMPIGRLEVFPRTEPMLETEKFWTVTIEPDNEEVFTVAYGLVKDRAMQNIQNLIIDLQIALGELAAEKPNSIRFNH